VWIWACDSSRDPSPNAWQCPELVSELLSSIDLPSSISPVALAERHTAFVMWAIMFERTRPGRDPYSAFPPLEDSVNPRRVHNVWLAVWFMDRVSRDDTTLWFNRCPYDSVLGAVLGLCDAGADCAKYDVD
jgi:hypothetical protein